jgi:16S rRNA (adenine1518-N6/adenine1519-N6)-dimethyltransferase
VTPTPDGLPTLGDVIREHGLSARKGLGQNFILDFNLTRRIAREAGPLAGTTVLEVGPGPGGLTRALFLEGAEKIIAIERDDRCLPILEQIAARYPGRLEIITGDALEMDPVKLVSSRPARIVANLPYGAASELLIKWLTLEPWPPWYDRMVLMFQREVAERIVATPGSKAYGRLSIIAQWRTAPKILFNLPARAFTPSPKVDSSVAEFVPREHPVEAGSSAALQTVTAAAFGQRRKMIRQSLKSLGQGIENLLEDLGIDSSLRAEALRVEQYCQISQRIRKTI